MSRVQGTRQPGTIQSQLQGTALQAHLRPENCAGYMSHNAPGCMAHTWDACPVLSSLLDQLSLHHATNHHPLGDGVGIKAFKEMLQTCQLQ